MALSTTSCDLLCFNKAILGDFTAWEKEMISKIQSLHPAFQICTITQVTYRLDWKITCFLQQRSLSLDGEASLL